MTLFKNYPWFWATFGFWCFAVTVGAWALIYSPFTNNDSSVISRFSTRINGEQAMTTFSLNQSDTPSSLENLTRRWEETGWKSLTPNTNLASLLLDLPKPYRSLLDPLIQVRVFQNPVSFRLLGLCLNAQSGKTYQWVSDVPLKALQTQGPAEVDFPLKPSSNAFDIFTLKTEAISASLWSIKTEANLPTVFAHIFSSQGFSGRMLNSADDEATYLLQKGSTRLFGVVRKQGPKMTISLMMFDKI